MADSEAAAQLAAPDFRHKHATSGRAISGRGSASSEAPDVQDGSLADELDFRESADFRGSVGAPGGGGGDGGGVSGASGVGGASEGGGGGGSSSAGGGGFAGDDQPSTSSPAEAAGNQNAEWLAAVQDENARHEKRAETAELALMESERDLEQLEHSTAEIRRELKTAQKQRALLAADCARLRLNAQTAAAATAKSAAPPPSPSAAWVDPVTLPPAPATLVPVSIVPAPCEGYMFKVGAGLVAGVGPHSRDYNLTRWP